MKVKKSKIMSIFLILLISLSGCNNKTQNSTGTTIEISEETSEEVSEANDASNKEDIDLNEIVGEMTIEEKAAQMVQGAVYNVSHDQMKEYNYGSILSTFGANRILNATQWKELVISYQEDSLQSESKVPFLFGNDAVHGVNTSDGTVIFPHNIGIGAANDEQLTYEMGVAVANESKLTGVLWSFSPCIAVAKDPRWGRTYESFSSDTEIVTSLGEQFSKGMLDGGVMPCAKHFFADGSEAYGTGEESGGIKRIIDRGDATLSEEEIEELLQSYQEMIDAGVLTIMISHGSVNGVKMHENKEYIMKLKEEMGFEGFIVSDWDSIHYITGNSLKEQTITAINSGIDMLMESDKYEDCRQYIVEAVDEGSISMDRIDDAVMRILKVKKELNLFEDPMMENLTSDVSTTGSKEYRDLSRKLVEKSMVLLNNDNEVLPIKKGTKIFVTGPAADDVGVQCGGWTLSWEGMTDEENNNQKWVEEGKTILDGLNELAKEYDLTIITDENNAKDADITLLCIGEETYAEWNGDSEDISITGDLALDGNLEAIEYANNLGHPTVTCIVAGRNVIIEDYMLQWEGIVMCYLPGSEGDGIANVLLGKSAFTGKLPMPYYKSVDDIGTDNYIYPVGYGLEY